MCCLNNFEFPLEPKFHSTQRAQERSEGENTARTLVVSAWCLIVIELASSLTHTRARRTNQELLYVETQTHIHVRTVYMISNIFV